MKTVNSDSTEYDDDLLPEYDIDYTKAKRNPYYSKEKTVIAIDRDVADAFQSSENINKILKAIVKSLPKNSVAVL